MPTDFQPDNLPSGGFGCFGLLNTERRAVRIILRGSVGTVLGINMRFKLLTAVLNVRSRSQFISNKSQEISSFQLLFLE